LQKKKREHKKGEKTLFEKGRKTNFGIFQIFLKKRLTNLDKHAIIVNCIIIAYYALLWALGPKA